MRAAKLVQLLTETLEKQGYKIRNEKGNFRGGRCIFEAERLVIMNKRFGDEERAEILARALARENLDTLFLLPEVREYVERHIAEPRYFVDLTADDTEPAAK